MQSIFLEVKVRDLVALQRRDAGRAEHEIKKKQKSMRAPRPHTPRQDCISCTRQAEPAVFFYFHDKKKMSEGLPTR